MLKELEVSFIRKRANFKQVDKTEAGYVYEVNFEGVVYYEVFRRKEVFQYDFENKTAKEDKKVTYPNDESFGIWAWCFNNYDRAKQKLKTITEQVLTDTLSH